MINAVYCYKRDVNVAMLKTLVLHNVFNVFVGVGYPNPKDDSRLVGIVPAAEVGIVITSQGVADLNRLFASVDSRLRLWGWFGTWSRLGTDDRSGHELAKVDLSTEYNRSIIIENIVKVAGWGFYGVQDDTEDVIQVSYPHVKTQNQVDFWNEEQAALTPIGIKLATFTYAGPPSLWTYQPKYNFVGQLNVDYIIAVADVRQTQEVYSSYGPIEQIWKSEVTTGLSVACSPVIVHLTTYDSLFPFKAQLACLPEIPASFVGISIYYYGEITSSDWLAWDNCLVSLGYEPEPEPEKPEPEPEPEPEPMEPPNFLYWILLIALGILSIVFLASSGMKKND